MKCSHCGRTGLKGRQGKGRHEFSCKENPLRGQRKKPVKAELVPVNGEVTKPRVQLKGFLQERELEAATAYVLAAKWPKGIPVEDMLRAVKIVKVVEHG